MCEKWGLKRSQLEEFSLESHARALHAIDEGRFDREITAIDGVTTDEGPHRDTSLEKMAELKPLREGWELTAATASQISDGSAAVLVASEDAVRRHGFTPRARIHALTVVGSGPVFMLTGPIPATEQALARGKLNIDDIDVFEVNEAFAPVLLAWSADTGASLKKTNPNGGAIALGHPLGATGAILMTKLLHELERTGGRSACRPCARVAARQTPRSSSASANAQRSLPRHNPRSLCGLFASCRMTGGWRSGHATSRSRRCF